MERPMIPGIRISRRLGLAALMACWLSGIWLAAAAGDPWIDPTYRVRTLVTGLSNGSAGDLVDFPVLIHLSNQEILGQARENGSDLTFAGVDGKQLFHEIEFFDHTNRRLLAWVCVPRFTNQTAIYLYASNGGSSLPFNGSNSTTGLNGSFTNLRTPDIATNVWDRDYDLVMHFGETTGLYRDSSRYGNHATNQSTNVQAGSNTLFGLGFRSAGVNGTGGIKVPRPDSLFGRTNTMTFWWNAETVVSNAGEANFFHYQADDGYILRAPTTVGNGFTRVMHRNYPTTGSPGYRPWNFGKWDMITATHVASNILSNNGSTNYYGVGYGWYTNGVRGGEGGNTSGAYLSYSAWNSATPLTICGSSVANSGGNSTGQYSGNPTGLMDEFRISRVVRSSNWIAAEHTNARLAMTVGMSCAALETPDRPGLASLAGGTVTNSTVTFSWTAGSYGAPWVRDRLILYTNGFLWTEVDAGTNLSWSTNLGKALGGISTNTISWFVTAETSAPSSHYSLTNTFVSALATRSRLQLTLQNRGGQFLEGVLVQIPVLPGGWQFSDSQGRVDLGSLVIRQPLSLILTPSGRHGLDRVDTNLVVPDEDLAWTMRLGSDPTNGSVVPLSARTDTPVFLAGQGNGLRIRLPDTWNETGLLSVNLQPLAGGRKARIFEGMVAPTRAPLSIPESGLSGSLTPGPYVLEVRLEIPGKDLQEARVFRRILFVAR